MIKKILKWIAYSFIALIALGMYLESQKTPEQKAAEAVAKAEKQAQEAANKQAEVKLEMASLPEIPVNSIAKAYNENTVAADQLYKGKTLKVTGSIAEISTGFTGEPYLILKGGVNMFMNPQAHFDSDFAPQIAKLKKGERVVIVCTGNGDVAKTPMLNGCVIP